MDREAPRYPPRGLGLLKGRTYFAYSEPVRFNKKSFFQVFHFLGLNLKVVLIILAMIVTPGV